jgi:hypothetical protein
VWICEVFNSSIGTVVAGTSFKTFSRFLRITKFIPSSFSTPPSGSVCRCKFQLLTCIVQAVLCSSLRFQHHGQMLASRLCSVFPPGDHFLELYLPSALLYDHSQHFYKSSFACAHLCYIESTFESMRYFELHNSTIPTDSSFTFPLGSMLLPLYTLPLTVLQLKKTNLSQMFTPCKVA